MLIGLYSPAPRSGKSTTARFIGDKVGCFLVMGFADPLKELVAEFAGHFLPGGRMEAEAMMCDDRKDTYIIPGIDKTLRDLLRTLGTSWGREMVHRHCWVQIAQRRVEKDLRYGPIIFDDVRFPDEFEMIKSLGGIMVKVHRPAAQGTGLGEGLLDNYSFDYTITNDKGLSELEGAVGALVREMSSPPAKEPVPGL